MRECVEEGLLTVHWVFSEENPAKMYRQAPTELSLEIDGNDELSASGLGVCVEMVIR